ncbi:MAG TPA: tetratricopeptide repeat protein [Vicinamibacterales bacterium]|nr:tetratricopeptide repeat protein [Vicinamibacterales bacterium]
MREARLFALLLLATAIGVSACSSPGSPPASAPAAGGAQHGPPAAASPLPDISKLVPSVQRQITEQHDWLVKTLARSDATLIDRANAHGELGKLLMAAQLPEAATAELVAAQSLDPSDYRWPYYLAHLARTQGDLPKAAGLFERVLQLRPDDMDALVWLGDVSLAAGRPDAAAPAFAHALQLDANSVSAKFGAGRAALARGEHQKAVEYLEDVLRLNPKATAAHYPLSQAYATLGDTDKSAEHLRLRRDGRIAPRDTLMVELDALLQSPQTFESLGIRRLDDEDWAGAADQFRKGLALAPDSAALHHRLGTALSMMDDARAARTEFETAVRLSPDYFPAQFSLGVLAQSQGQHAQAIARFEAALKARPTYTEARLRLASSLRRSGRLNDALREYEQALAGAPDNPEARIGQVMLLSKLQRDREAVRALNEVLPSSGGDPALTHALARLLATSPDDTVRNGQRAMELVQQMLQKGRTLDLGETYAMTLAELGQFREAQALQRDLIAAAQRAGMSPMRARLIARLALYDRADPCRTPWTDEEMP